jgi:DNA repair exonuclease SbcCD nuclease subunit
MCYYSGNPYVASQSYVGSRQTVEVSVGFKFIHMADVHLGTLQYGIQERVKDFAKAFKNVAEFAVDRGVDFVLIAGDLFDRSNPSPSVLWQAEVTLKLLKDNRIPVVAIAGNHDRGDYRQGEFSWLTYLAAHGLLSLLDFSREGDKFHLHPWDSAELRGGYIDVGGARIMGLRYLGLGVTNVLEKLMPSIERLAREKPYTILMLHVGIQGYTLPGQVGAEPMKLKPLEGLIRYLALGHIHREYRVKDWIFNPGSLETWRMDEADVEHGFYLVQVEDDGQHTVTHHSSEVRRRPFWVIKIDLSPCRALSHVVQVALREASKRVHRDPLDKRYPVVVLELRGKLSFDLGPEDEDRLRQEFREGLGFDEGFLPFVRVKWSQDPTPLTVGEHRLGSYPSRDAMEQAVWEELYLNDTTKRDQAHQWAQFAVEVRRKALDLGTLISPKELADLVENRWRDLVARS